MDGIHQIRWTACSGFGGRHAPDSLVAFDWITQAQVNVCENAKGEVTILYKNNPLAYSIYHQPSRQAEVVNTKTIDRHIKTPKPPAPDHPWRKYGQHLSGKPIQETSPQGSD